MKYKLLLLDIDGTLRPGSCERVPKENAEAVCAVQKAGVKIGSHRAAGIRHWVCAGGARLLDSKGRRPGPCTA